MFTPTMRQPSLEPQVCFPGNTIKKTLPGNLSITKEAFGQKQNQSISLTFFHSPLSLLTLIPLCMC